MLRFTKAARLLVHPRWRKSGGSRRSCSPFHRVERSVFETVPARLSGSTSYKNGGPPRCRPVLCGLRDRCIAAMLVTRSGSQWSCPTNPRGFQPVSNRRRFACPLWLPKKSGGGGWNRTSFLQRMRLASVRCSSPRLKLIHQPGSHWPLPVTDGARRCLRFGGVL